MRRLVTFSAADEMLVGTLDHRVPAKAGPQTEVPPSREHTFGVLIVSGGNELRIGAHRGMAMLAAQIAETAVPVFRFDRRGIGDSSGAKGGYLSSAPDIAAAAAAFRTETGVTRIVGFGNCDAASALALFGRAAGIERVVLANPWLRDEPDALPPAAAIRARYAARMRDPASWRRLLGGGVDLRKLVSGLRKLMRRERPAADAFTGTLDAIRAWGADATIVLARGDATAIAFADRAGGALMVETIDTASHSFAGAENEAALLAILLRVAL